MVGKYGNNLIQYDANSTLVSDDQNKFNVGNLVSVCKFMIVLLKFCKYIVSKPTK